MNLIEESFQRLFPERKFSYATKMEYNRKLADFNANIRWRGDTIHLHLNLQWKDIDDEIKIGLIQSLLLKMLPEKKHTQNIEIYNNFIKNIPLLTLKTRSDPQLEASFHRVNAQFFERSLLSPNLRWGTPSFRKLASYNFHRYEVTVSTLFNDARPELLDYLMYHELLHKHHAFTHKNGRSAFHTREFRRDEQRYPQHQQIEQEITATVKRKKNGEEIFKKAMRFWKKRWCV